jgi:hypothetical protein
MNVIRKHRHMRRLSLALVVIMVLSLAPLGLGTAFAEGTSRSVLVFALGNAAENAPGEIGEQAATALSLAIGDVAGMEGVQFSSTSPSVRRAVSEGRVRQVDVDVRERDLGTALIMGRALKADYILVGNVQSMVKKDNPVAVEVILAGQMYDVAANLNPDTGEPVAEPKVSKAFGVSGASASRARYTGSDGTLIREALRDAAAKAAQALSGRPVESAEAKAGKKVSSGYKWVLLGLLVAGLALAVNNSGSKANTGTSAQAFPPRNVVLEEQDSQVRLTWTEPTGTTLTLLRYQIERSVDGNTFARVDPGTLGAGTSSFIDFNTLSGRHVYQYRIRAFYTSGDQSAWAISGALVVTR